MNYSFKFLIIFILLTTGCSKHQPATVEDYSNRFYGFGMEDEGAYRIKYPKFIQAEQGDSYKKISLTYNIPLKELLKANNETAKRKLNIGEVIYLPQIVFHKVAHGENLDLIANLYQTSKKKIIKNNNIADTNIKVGETLKIFNYEDKPTHIESATINSNSNYVATESTLKEVILQESPTPTTNLAANKFSWPLQGKILKSFNPAPDSRYDGINIAASLNAPIKASADGKIVYIGNELKGYGNMIIIKHNNGWLSAYAHQNNFSVTKGQQVKAGDIIGYVGQTGNVDSPQLYFAIRRGIQPFDPIILLDQ